MDPNQALSELLTALVTKDRDTAITQLDALADWLSKDGFLPTVRSQPCNDRDVRIFTVHVKGDKA